MTSMPFKDIVHPLFKTGKEHEDMRMKGPLSLAKDISLVCLHTKCFVKGLWGIIIFKQNKLRVKLVISLYTEATI